MKKLFAFFYIDALDSRFFKPHVMPFLTNFVKNHHFNVLENVVGYSFAIQSCMLSGKYPDESNHWMPYFCEPKKSPMLFNTLSKLGKIIPFDRFPIIRHLTVGRARCFIHEDGVRVNSIPFSVLDNFSLYPYYYLSELPFFIELKELFEKKYDLPLTYIGPPGVKHHYYESLIKYLKKSTNEKEFVFIYDDALDGIGHRFGPNSFQSLEYLKSLDSVLKQTYLKLKKYYGKNLTFLIFSDHAQCEKTFEVDLLNRLTNIGLKIGRDYICFIDATIALFWPQNEESRHKILGSLSAIDFGKTLDNKQRKYYHIDFPDDRFGEIIFALNPGGTFYPNFYSPFGAMKGLHGYLPEEEVQKSFLISNNDFGFKITHVKDVRNLLIKLVAT